MNIMLGNMTIEEMEKRSGVIFPDELKEYMLPRHQAKADNVQSGKWHCFDIPFTLVVGDMETATHIYGYLKDMSHQFETPLQIALAS